MCPPESQSEVRVTVGNDQQKKCLHFSTRKLECVGTAQRSGPEKMQLWIVLLCAQTLYVHSFTTLSGLMSRSSTSLRCVERTGILETREKRPRGIRYPVAPRPLFFKGRKEDFKGKGVRWDRCSNPSNPLKVQADGLVYPQGEHFGNPAGKKLFLIHSANHTATHLSFENIVVFCQNGLGYVFGTTLTHLGKHVFSKDAVMIFNNTQPQQGLN